MARPVQPCEGLDGPSSSRPPPPRNTWVRGGARRGPSGVPPTWGDAEARRSRTRSSAAQRRQAASGIRARHPPEADRLSLTRTAGSRGSCTSASSMRGSTSHAPRPASRRATAGSPWTPSHIGGWCRRFRRRQVRRPRPVGEGSGALRGRRPPVRNAQSRCTRPAPVTGPTGRLGVPRVRGVVHIETCGPGARPCAGATRRSADVWPSRRCVRCGAGGRAPAEAGSAAPARWAGADSPPRTGRGCSGRRSAAVRARDGAVRSSAAPK